MSGGLRVNDISPVGERPGDRYRGRVGASLAGVDSLVGVEMVGTLADGQVWIYDSGSGTLIPGDVSGPITVEDEGVDTGDDASVLNFVGAGVTATGSGGTKTITIPGGGSDLGWFNVKDYGAIGDGTTDDTAAINLAIAALNAAGKGVLYFPAGTYKVTGALTTITASGTVLGDGMGAYDGSANVSAINCTSQTAVLFTVTGEQLAFHDIGLFNTYVGNPSAGAAIQVSGSFIGQKVDLDSVVLSGFYINIDRQVGSQWSNVNVWNWGPVLYGEKIQNTVNQDAGDWSISNSFYYADTHNATAGIFQLGAGGGKLVNVKFNGHGGATFTNSLLCAFPTGVASSILVVTGCSFENMSGDAILITTTGTGHLGHVSIIGNQFGLYSNNTGRAVKISAATHGVITTNGSIAVVSIDGGTMHTDGTARAAIELVKTDRVTLGDFQLSGFNARYTSSSDTNTTDGASVSFATPAIVLGTAAAAGAAATVIRSDSTIVAFDATAPVTQAFGDAAATGSAAVAARRDHKHGMPATPATASATDHEHVINVVFSGDASATAWELPAAPVDSTSIAVYVAGSRSIAWALSGALLTTLTFDAAPAAAANNIVIDIVAATA